MADSGGETEPSLHVAGAAPKKVKLSKRDYSTQIKRKMTKYYADPEKQAKLKERIAEYEEQSKTYQLKANELKQYLTPEIQTHPGT